MKTSKWRPVKSTDMACYMLRNKMSIDDITPTWFKRKKRTNKGERKQ